MERKNAIKTACCIDDQPAVIKPDGTQMWCEEGMIHRGEGPKRKMGFCRFGLEFSLDYVSDGKPAVIKPDGTKELWYRGEKIG